MDYFGNDEVELFFEKLGAKFNAYATAGRGIIVVWTLGNLEYFPYSHEFTVKGASTFHGPVVSMDRFLKVLDCIEIDVKKLYNMEQAKENARFKKERKAAIAQRIASCVQKQYLITQEESLALVLKSTVYKRFNRTSQLNNHFVDVYAAEVFKEIDNGSLQV